MKTLIMDELEKHLRNTLDYSQLETTRAKLQKWLPFHYTYELFRCT